MPTKIAGCNSKSNKNNSTTHAVKVEANQQGTAYFCILETKNVVKIPGT